VAQKRVEREAEMQAYQASKVCVLSPSPHVLHDRLSCPSTLNPSELSLPLYRFIACRLLLAALHVPARQAHP
jgi:hypothetical protein